MTAHLELSSLLHCLATGRALVIGDEHLSTTAALLDNEDQGIEDPWPDLMSVAYHPREVTELVRELALDGTDPTIAGVAAGLLRARHQLEQRAAAALEQARAALREPAVPDLEPLGEVEGPGGQRAAELRTEWQVEPLGEVPPTPAPAQRVMLARESLLTWTLRSDSGQLVLRPNGVVEFTQDEDPGAVLATLDPTDVAGYLDRAQLEHGEGGQVYSARVIDAAAAAIETSLATNLAEWSA